MADLEPHRVDIPMAPVGCHSCARLWAELHEKQDEIDRLKHLADTLTERCFRQSEILNHAAGQAGVDLGDTP